MEDEDADGEVTFVVEKDEVTALVSRVEELQGAVEPSAYARISRIVERYQEFSQLLDPHLEAWIAPLAAVLRAQARLGDDADMILVQRVCSVLHAFATVRGYKTVCKFFPHEAKDLEPVVHLLVRSHDARLSASTIEEADELGTAWETRAVLILWLSILVLIPFDLVTVDSEVDGGGDAAAKGDAEAPPVVMRILDLCQSRYLSDPGIVRDRAAYLLARLLTRPDMPKALARFLDWAADALARAGDSDRSDAAEAQEAQFLVPGVARALAAIFKLGTRDALLGVASRAWGDARDLAASPEASGSALVRQLACKLAQRIGLLFLRPRVVTWRYERGARSLSDTLKPKTGAEQTEAAKGAESEDEDEDEDELDDVPDEIEEVVESLLGALADKDTVVRWSAAKGLGRVVARLPASLGDDVVGSILETFDDPSDSTRHGACLALAELARRGLLLPARLPDAAPRVAAALAYDVRRGPHSVGAHVRDAAAYACWAFARAYAPEIFAPHARALAPALLATACFDREVNCRRAAAAAFQEAVGRLGAELFPRGIDIVGAADYFALGSRRNAYHAVADFVCGLDAYRPALLAHLVDVKLQHWERATRELAASALATLGARDPAWTRRVALPGLLDRSLSPALENRHGATLGAAEALRALRRAGEAALDGELGERVVSLVLEIEKARLYRGKGGEVMRAATCRYVECLALAAQPLDVGQSAPKTGPKSIRSRLLASLEENLRHPTADIREAAVRALGAFALEYMTAKGGDETLARKSNAAGAKRLVAKLAATLREDPNPAARRGAAAAIGAMPAALLLAPIEVDSDSAAEGEAEAEPSSGKNVAPPRGQKTSPAWRVALDALRVASVPEEDPEVRDAEARVCAVRGMAGALETLEKARMDAGGEAGSDSGGTDSAALARAVLDFARETIASLLTCVAEDYCVDNRGDVGSWVREAAMETLPAALAAAQAARAPADAETEREVVAALLKQAAEKIDRTRATAATALAAVLRGRPERTLAPLLLAPARDALLVAAPETETSAASWAAPATAFERLAPLLDATSDDAPLAKYRASLVEGFVVSAGGVGDSLGRAAGGALVARLKAGGLGLQTAVAEELCAVLERRQGCDRVTIPLLRVLDLCFSSGAFAAVAPAPPAPPAPFAARLAKGLRTELRGSRDVAKLCLGVQALCHLAALGAEERAEERAEEGEGESAARENPPARELATHALLALLVNRYPRVRRVAAEQLYVTLLGMDGDEYGGDAEAAAELLSDTRWDAGLAVVKPARNELYPLLGLVAPANATAAPKGKGVAAAATDENESYAALVGSAGY